jgi:hypothetical protein
LARACLYPRLDGIDSNVSDTSSGPESVASERILCHPDCTEKSGQHYRFVHPEIKTESQTGQCAPRAIPSFWNAGAASRCISKSSSSRSEMRFRPVEWFIARQARRRLRAPWRANVSRGIRFSASRSSHRQFLVRSTTHRGIPGEVRSVSRTSGARRNPDGFVPKQSSRCHSSGAISMNSCFRSSFGEGNRPPTFSIRMVGVLSVRDKMGTDTAGKRQPRSTLLGCSRGRTNERGFPR